MIFIYLSGASRPSAGTNVYNIISKATVIPMKNIICMILFPRIQIAKTQLPTNAKYINFNNRSSNINCPIIRS